MAGASADIGWRCWAPAHHLSGFTGLENFDPVLSKGFAEGN